MNNFKDKIARLNIDKAEYEEFLVALKSYSLMGMDIYSSIETFIFTAEPSFAFEKRLKLILSELKKNGLHVVSELLYEEEILINENEKAIFEKANEKHKAIELILDNRQKHKNLTKEIATNYFLHLLAALTLMSWYLFEDTIIQSIVTAGTMLNETKKGIYLKPDYWVPFEVFLISSIYFIWAFLSLIITLFGQFINYKIYYKIQKHQETNNLISALKLLEAQVRIGNNLYDSLEAIVTSVDKSISIAFKKILKDMKGGNKKFFLTMKNSGFSNATSISLKGFDSATNDSEVITRAINILDGRREKLKTTILKRNKNNATMALIFSNVLLTLLIAFEVYRASVIGINLI